MADGNFSQFFTAKDIDAAGGKKQHLGKAETASLSKELDALDAALTGGKALDAQVAAIEAALKTPVAVTAGVLKDSNPDKVRADLDDAMNRSIRAEFSLAAARPVPSGINMELASFIRNDDASRVKAPQKTLN